LLGGQVVLDPQERHLSLRQMAEIDNDPDTFTDAGQRNFVVLQQVLGSSPLPVTTPQSTSAAQMYP